MSYRIRLAFRREPGSLDMPWLVAAVDEYTIDAWNGLPDFYLDEMEKDPDTRELEITIPEEAIRKLFEVPKVAAKIVEG